MTTATRTGSKPPAGDIRTAIQRLCSLYPDLVNAAKPAAGPLGKLSSDQVEQLEVFLETLLVWRERMSLITTRAPLSIVEHHFLDSLFIAPLLSPGDLVADLGSGAGFPGIPLSIACPSTHFTLVEPRRKRANFLREVVRSSSINNVGVIQERAESLPRDRASLFDVTVTRAVWTTDDFLRASVPLLKNRGRSIAMKGPQRDVDPEAAHGLKLESTIDYTLPGKRGRSLLVYTQTST